MRRHLLLLLLLAGGAGAPAFAGVGVVTQAAGAVQLLRADAYVAAEPGVEIEEQDIVETGADASAQIDMEDGTVLKLGPDSRLAVSEYRLGADKGVLAAGLDLLSGWLRFAVAKLKPDSSYNIHTPVLTIGVRGTEGAIEADNDAGGLHLEEGEVQVSAADAPGAASATPVRVAAGEYIQRRRGQAFQRQQQPPPEFLKKLPPGLQQKLQHRAHELRARGLPPRVIRRINQEDAQRLLQRHPHMRERLQQRFQPLTAPGARPGAMTPREQFKERRMLQRQHEPPMRADPALADRLRGGATPPAGGAGMGPGGPGRRGDPQSDAADPSRSKQGDRPPDRQFQKAEPRGKEPRHEPGGGKQNAPQRQPGQRGPGGGR